ncbi:rhodanese-like domain-containing protein [Galbibacter sp.]|jgi:rhodanese-related sulfurtransferase|uniref:rhodanese-like domain-containing protein n=1 Tax=Galbibacter sp. TaxID=2918471 RepID=UPI003A8CA656
MRILVLLTLFLTGAMMSAQFKSVPISTLEGDESEQGILIDVRTEEEYNQGHLCDALNVDFKAEDFEAKIQELDKSTAVYLYCKTGVRSKDAATLLQELGFENIINLEGGYTAYIEESGKPCSGT